MQLAVIIIGTSALLAITSYIYRRIFWRLVNDSQEVHRFDQPEVCRGILDCKNIEKSKLEITVIPIESRANPNQRLARVFKIDNAFTTSDDHYSKRFRSSAAKKLQAVDGEKWKEIADMAGKLVDRWIKQEKDHEEGIPLVTFVQTVTMSVSLHVLFDSLSPLELEENNVAQAADCINELWILSKKIPLDDDFVATQRLKLYEALERISPDFEFTPRETPLNFILPAYETLWRVVLRCFIEVSFRNADSAQKWRGILHDFHVNPSGTQFKAWADGANVSVSFIVSEALRLYPPTSRVHREYQIDGESSKTVAADIESCQRRETIWGADSKLFRPTRWNDLSKEAKEAFMPFGGGRFICPARETFGPRMIGVLVAALVSGLSPDEWKIGSGKKHEGIVDYEWPKRPLESGRTAYSSLKLWRKST